MCVNIVKYSQLKQKRRKNVKGDYTNVWFDNGENWEIDNNGIPYTNIEYHGYYLTVAFENGQYMVYDQDGCPLDCTINEIPNLIKS